MTDPGHPDGRSRRPWIEVLPEQQADLEDTVVFACDKLAQAQAALQRTREGVLSAIAGLPQETVGVEWIGAAGRAGLALCDLQSCPGTLIVTTVVMECAVREIQLRDAKATLSAVIDQARQGQPSVITRHGRPEAVVLSFEEWQRLSQVPSFGRLLMAAPLEPEDLPARQDGLRDAGL